MPTQTTSTEADALAGTEMIRPRNVCETMIREGTGTGIDREIATLVEMARLENDPEIDGLEQQAAMTSDGENDETGREDVTKILGKGDVVMTTKTRGGIEETAGEVVVGHHDLGGDQYHSLQCSLYFTATTSLM